MPLVEGALTPMGHCKPMEEYARVIASTNHLEILCFVTGLPLVRLPKRQKAVLISCMRQNTQCIPSGSWRGRAGAIPGPPSKGRVRKAHYDLGSKWSGEHHKYITQPWFQDDLGAGAQYVHPYRKVISMFECSHTLFTNISYVNIRGVRNWQNII